MISKQKYIIILSFVLVCSGCGYKGWGTVDNSLPVDTAGYRLYGNFCGPGYPHSGFSNPEQELKFLASIHPYDLIDKICKIHDMCYARFTNNEFDCDNQLRKNIIKISPYMPKTKIIHLGRGKIQEVNTCKKVLGQIEHAFLAKNMPDFIQERPYLSPVAVYFGVFSAIFLALGEGLAQPSEYDDFKICGDIDTFPGVLDGEVIIKAYSQ